MSTRSVPQSFQVLKRKPEPASTAATRIVFWALGIVLATAQAWVFRYQASADSMAYLDMSDGVLPGGDWHRLINGVWSPLHPFLIGLVRLIFRISAPNEIVAAHFMNIGFFVFAFACFEYFLHSTTTRTGKSEDGLAEPAVLVPLPRWAYLSLAYSLFLWASISAISMRNLRPDMLMSGFLYLAVGLLLRMRNRPAQWREFLALGVVLGIGFLAKEPMLPIGVLILAISVFVVENWRPALKMAATALALVFLIGSLYFVPLSRALKHPTLGESGVFNYIVHIDQVGPTWYSQDPGRSRGTLVHRPERIFLSPPAYAFPLPQTVTHPLRFDPSGWVVGLRPRFVLRPQLWALRENIVVFGELLRELVAVAALVVLLAWVLHRQKKLIESLRSYWPLWLIGLAGCAMYELVHVEPRYAAAFLVLLGLGIILGMRIPDKLSRKTALPIFVVVASLLLPIPWRTYVRHSQGVGKFDADAQAAAELGKLGIHPGDRVARISPVTEDLGIERIARVEVAAEVDIEHTNEFWTAPESTQKELLNAFTSRGAKAVIATTPKLNDRNSSEWKQLGATQYWAWLPKAQ